jgi:hypothetical protein
MLHIPIKSTYCLFCRLSKFVNFITNYSIISSAKDITLCKTKQSTYLLIIFSLLAISPGYVYAKNDVIELPENATAKSYGTGWNCDKGYREKNSTCEVVIVPDNAYPTNKVYGIGWECNRGFRKRDDACIVIKIPVNGYLDYDGKQLKCNRGYLMVDKFCKVINVPKNGFLTKSAYGPGWECERGYQADKDACISIKLPENSHINFSGNNWECNKPYQRRNNQCILPHL